MIMQRIAPKKPLDDAVWRMQFKRKPAHSNDQVFQRIIAPLIQFMNCNQLMIQQHAPQVEVQACMQSKFGTTFETSWNKIHASVLEWIIFL